MVPQAGIEPATQGFSVLCSTNWATEAMADQTGIEPAIFSVTGRHVNRYTTGPKINCLFIMYKYQIKSKCFFENYLIFLSINIFLVKKQKRPIGLLNNLGCREWIWTNDLRVMSPTSYQTALLCDIANCLFILTLRFHYCKC